MKRLLVYCEGPTEELFAADVLAPHFLQADIFAIPTGAGGVSRYAQIKKDLTLLCKNSDALVTTMLDFYGLPSNAPGVKSATGSIYEIARQIEVEIESDINCDNLLVYLAVVRWAIVFKDI